MGYKGLRIVAASLALLPMACTGTVIAPPRTAAAVPVASTTTLAAPDGRQVEVTIVAPDSPRGVILFSHGAGSAPAVTQAHFDRWVERGFAVLAPTHTDSLKIPAERRTSLQAALATRVADMKLVASHASKNWSGLPLAQVGYSYGSLIALIGGGAMAGLIPGTIPAVKAIVMFSSPGPIAPLTSMTGAFTKVTAPTLLVTGTADTVPGFVPDPESHLVYFNGLPEGRRTALIVKLATHEFIRGDQPGWSEVSAIVEDFLASRVLEDGAAGQRFDAAKSTEIVEVRRR